MKTDILFSFHRDMAWVSIIVNLAAGMWMLTALKVTTLKRKKYFFVPVFLGWLAMVIQVALGVSLYMNGYQVQSSKGIHYFYGFIVLLTASVLFSYRDSLADKKILIFGISSLFIGALGLRTALVVLL